MVVIFDFDGVLADTYQAHVNFLTQSLWFSDKQAQRRLAQESKLPAKRRSPIRIIERMYYKRFRTFINKYNNLVDPHRIAQVRSMPVPKYIVSRSDKQICADILGDDYKMFNDAFDRFDYRTKAITIQHLIHKYGYDPASTLFVTDTYSDLKDVGTILPRENMYATSWGFDSVKRLTQIIDEGNILDSDFSKIVQRITTSNKPEL